MAILKMKMRVVHQVSLQTEIAQKYRPDNYNTGVMTSLTIIYMLLELKSYWKLLVLKFDLGS